MAFSERKVAQMAAYFLSRNDGTLPIVKLMKLLYLADRKSLEWFGMPISGDRMVSMPHGPVLSRTYDLMSGSSQSGDGGWDCWVADRAAHAVSLKDCDNRAAPDFPDLSDADLEILDSIQAEFGHMGKWEIRDYTHDRCAEWRDPQGSSRPIFYKDVFLALGRSSEEASAAQQEIESYNSMDQLFARL